MSSIVDVARRAQVGTSTVSRVLSGKGYVSDATRRKVMEAVKVLDYAPNALARNLLQNRSFIIAVIVPDISNYFFSTLVNEIECHLRKQGYKTMLCNSLGSQTNEEAYLNMLACNMVDGVTGTDILALQYAHSAMANGKRIPEDVKIVAYDGTEFVKLFYPEVCAIVQPIAEIAENAAELLLRRIEGKPVPDKRVILPVSVINKL